MAATLNITDGTTTVNLISEKVDYQLRADGYSQSDPEMRQIRRQSQYSEGEAIIASEPNNIIDTFTIAVYGASHDAVATNLQKLAALKRKAEEYETTSWQKVPVYLTAKTANETNTRYARVIQIRVLELSPLFNSFFNSQSAIPQATIIVEHEQWTAQPPRSTNLLALTQIRIGAPQAPSPQADDSEQFIANFRDTTNLTHIYNFDDSAGTFSSNLTASSSFTYFPATPALNDIVYFGSTIAPFRQIVLNIGVVGVFNWAITWEWWNGAAWTSAAFGVSTNTLTFTASSLTGTNLIVVDAPTGWASNVTVNGITPAFWIRARISTFTSWTSSPTQTGQVVYNPRDSYISLTDTTQIKGDVDAVSLLKYFKQVRTNRGLDFVAFGMKSRGLTTFTSRFNFGEQNPAAWTITYGSDTTQIGDIQSPSGRRASCTFAATTTAAERVRVSTITNQNIIDLEGRYHAYLRCQQIGGTVGAVSVYLRQTYGLVTDGPTISPKAVAGGVEILDMGRIEIIGSKILGAETANLDLRFSIIASATSTTPDLYIYDLVLIPIDEYALVSQITDGTMEALERTTGLDFDGGLFRNGEAVYKGGTDGAEATSVIGNWEHRGKPFRLPPDKAFQIHFVFATQISGIYYAGEYLGGSFKLYAHERWEFMRGAE